MINQDLEIKNLGLEGSPSYTLATWNGGKREALGTLAPGMSQVVNLGPNETLQAERVREKAAPKPTGRVQPAPTVQPFPAATGKGDVPVEAAPVPPAATTEAPPATPAAAAADGTGGTL